MDSKLQPYLIAAIISNIADRQGNLDKSYIQKDKSLEQLELVIDRIVPRDELDWAFDDLLERGIFVSIQDEFAGDFFRLDPSPAIGLLNAGVKDQNSLIYKYRTIGPNFLQSAMRRFSEAADHDPSRVPLESARSAPASDRVVRLDHNQASLFDEQISELVEELEGRDNGDPDQPGLRERILGQIKAGRELIRAGEFRVYLLYEVLVRALGELIDKYGNPTVKALANALLGALVSQIIEG